MGCCCSKKKKSEGGDIYLLSAKEREKLGLSLSDGDRSALKSLFDRACSTPGKCSAADLKRLWGNKCDEKLLDQLIAHLFGDPPKEYISFEEFTKLYELMAMNDMSQVTKTILGQSQGKSDGQRLCENDVDQFMQGIVDSCFQKLKETAGYKSWKNKTAPLNPEISTEKNEAFGKKNLASFLVYLQKMNDTDNKRLQNENEMDWAVKNNQKLISDVANSLYEMEEKIVASIPMCIASSKYGPPSILDLSSILMINMALPKSCQSRWRALFSSRLDGNDFETFLDGILYEGPTLVIVADTGGHVFGGFAPVHWKVGPHFLGNEDSFIFQLLPEKALYKATGKNPNYMYLDISEQLVPNGLGMGGQIGCFGFFVDKDFKRGHSREFCPTYGNPCLSSGRDFTVAHLEAWGVS